MSDDALIEGLRRYLEQLSPEQRKEWGFDEPHPDSAEPETPGDR